MDTTRNAAGNLEVDTSAPTGSAEGADDHLPSTGLLSFYDRLRRRILAAVRRRGGRLGQPLVEALLVVPDVFILLARLSLDKEVPASTRAALAGALAYFVLPADLWPEMVVGAGGYIDDLVLALSVLSQALDRDLEPLAEKHWSGPQTLRRVLRDVLLSAHVLAGSRLYERLGKYLARRGIELEEAG